MILHKILSLFPLSLLSALFLFAPFSQASLSDEGPSRPLYSPAARLSPEALIDPLKEAWPQLSNPALDSHQSLTACVLNLQDQFNDIDLTSLIRLAGYYSETIQTGAGTHMPYEPRVTFKEMCRFLKTAASIQIDYEGPNACTSNFAYDQILRICPKACFQYQLYYMRLFSNVFVQTERAQETAEHIIDWSLPFMRKNHSYKQCSDIATLVTKFVLAQGTMHPNALDQAWGGSHDISDDEIVSFLTGKLFHQPIRR
jgi:hypothetical protein